MKSSPRIVSRAAFASLFCPALGQLYNGQLKKALAISFGFFLLTYLFLSWANGVVWLQGVVCLVAIALYAYAFFDAISVSKKYGKDYELKKTNTIFNYLLLICLKINIRYAIFYALGFMVFKVPTSSSYPNIKPGDKLIVDRNAFDVVEPNYGDMIVFRDTLPEGDFFTKTYRVVGLPRDRFGVKNNSAVINGKYMMAEFLGDLPSKNARELSPQPSFHNNGHNIFSFKIYREFYPNDFSHLSCKNATEGIKQPMENMEAIDIPSQHYFVMGDHRDNALDSRFSGLVPRQDILGKIKEETITSNTLEAYQFLFFWSSDLSNYFNLKKEKRFKIS